MNGSLVRIAIPALILCGCAAGTERRLQSTYQTATDALRRGDFDQARALADRGLTRARSQPGSEWVWKFRFVRAEALLSKANVSEAASVAGEPMPSGPAYDELRARQAYLHAKTQVLQGHITDALSTIEDAQRLSARFPQTALDIDILAGQVLLRLARWSDGQTTLERAVASASNAGDHYRQALALNNLGMGFLVRNRFDQALPYFDRVLALKDVESYAVYSTALYNAGICHAALGQFDIALERQHRAVDALDRLGPSTNLEKALGNLGHTYLDKGSPETALPFLVRALKVATDPVLAADATAGADAAIWASDLAGAHADLQNWGAAERYNDEGRRLRIEKHTGKLGYNTLTAAQIAKGRGRLDQAERLFQQALSEPDADPWIQWSAHAGIANVAAAQKQWPSAIEHFEAALNIIDRTRSQLARTDDKLAYLTRLIAFYHDYVDVLVDQGQVERALEIADSSRARVLSARAGASQSTRGRAVDFRRIADRTHGAVLFYSLAHPKSYMWVVTGDRVRCLTLPAADAIEALVHEYEMTVRTSSKDPLTQNGGAGDRLYEILVRPAAQWLQQSHGTPEAPRRISFLIVPDGALHTLNFETLPVLNGKRPHYWIEDAEVQIAPSLSMLAAGDHARAQGQRLVLLIGDPTQTDPDFPALRYAPAEISTVSRHFPVGDVVSVHGEHATPGAYRAAGPQRFSLVHFTAHAVANAYSPLDSAVILARDPNGYKLYARDVAEQPLHADLVTVSACRSAGERAYSGEGLIGFAWAFLRAGARRVIAGLWDVDDQSTADLMDSLYGDLQEGGSPASALRQAKLTLMRRGGNFAKPYYWGPFELFTVTP